VAFLLIEASGFVAKLGRMVLDSGEFFFSNLVSVGQVLFFMQGDSNFNVFVTISALRCETSCALGYGSCIDGDFNIEVWAYGNYECIPKSTT
jgi:hypothetical protein